MAWGGGGSEGGRLLWAAAKKCSIGLSPAPDGSVAEERVADAPQRVGLWRAAAEEDVVAAGAKAAAAAE